MDNVNFVFLGNKPPAYAKDSITLANKYSGLPVTLIANKKIYNKLKVSKLNFIPLEEFYDDTKFKSIQNKVDSSVDFRNGFWLKTLERFFVLEQFVNKFELEDFLHAELDQLIFRADLLVSKLKSTGIKGFYIPFHNKNSAVASMIYCNEISSIKSFVKFIQDFPGKFNNEMVLLAKWAKQNPKMVYALPTISSEINGTKHLQSFGIVTLKEAELGGVVDAAQIGQWIGGQDPRNLPLKIKPLNKFWEPGGKEILSHWQLKKLFFTLNTDDTLTCNFFGEREFRIFNLHLHSKVHPWLLGSKNFSMRFIQLANSDSPIAIPYARKQQILYRFTYIIKEYFSALKSDPSRVKQIPKKTFALFVTTIRQKIRSVFIVFNFHPSSEPFLSGDTFREISKYRFESNSKKINVDYFKKNDLVFCQGDLLFEFNEEVLKINRTKINIIIANSDLNLDEFAVSSLYLENVNKVFAQNLLVKHPKFEPMPIGLENLRYLNNGIPIIFRLLRLNLRNKNYRIMFTFNESTNPIRSSIAEDFRLCPTADQIGFVSSFKHANFLRKYSFVLSPPGNGEDCHRTWEAMYLGCVPIVKRSYLAEEFKNLDLPILVVDSFAEIKNFSEEELKVLYEGFIPKFNSKALWFNYWKDKIRSNT